MRVALVGDYSFEEAGSVTEALEVARRRLSGDPGLGAAHCVVVSAFAAEDDRKEAREAGAVAFVSKPFDPDELSATVAALLGRAA
jgi:CheY-like chemotaxis protein